MGSHKEIEMNAKEELQEQFRTVGMDREPNEAEIRQRVHEMIQELSQEPKRKPVWPNHRPTKS